MTCCTNKSAERELDSAVNSESEIAVLEDAITELAAHISAATYRLLTLVRDYDLRKGWNDGGSKSCAHWLNWKCGIALGAAREKVRVAHALAELPEISAAFREGRLSYSKVRAMTRVATSENESYLMMIADHGTATHVERLVRGYRRLGRLEAAEQETNRHAERELRWYVDVDGSYVFTGRMPPEQGARLVAALEHAADAQFRERGGEENVPAGTSSDVTEPAAARFADALDRVAEGYLASPNCSSNGGDRHTVHLHCNAETLRSAKSEYNEDSEEALTSFESELEPGIQVSAETSRRLACDCGMVHWQESEDGNPLNVGRRTRSIPAALRRALQRRDGGCTFPGCTAVHHADAHHIQHWADGGETRLSNLILLCRHHHRLVHEGGYGVRLEKSGLTTFTTSAGEAVPRGADTRSRGNVDELQAANQRQGAAIDPETARSRWRGERMDLGMAVEALKHKSSG